MIKYWQSMYDYKYFSPNPKSISIPLKETGFIRSFGNHGRSSGFSIPIRPWSASRLFYSATGRPVKNQPQILRSFILFFLLFSECLAKLSLSLWVDRLKHDRVLAALIGCSTDSLPPLGSYFDFMDRRWAAPDTDLYARDKLLPASWNSKKPGKPKGKKQKAQETNPKIIEAIEKRLMDGKDIPFNFEQRLQRFFYHTAVLPSVKYGLIPGGTPYVCSEQTSRCSCSLPAQGGMIRSISLSLSMNWKNICGCFHHEYVPGFCNGQLPHLPPP